MAKDKKSFLLYCDIINMVRKLNNEQAGKLFKHILSYVNDENPKVDDQLLEIAFEPIRQQLKRDLIKYDSIRKKNSDNARKRWDAVECDRKKRNAKYADNDNVSDNVSDNDNKDIPVYIEFEKYALEKQNNTDLKALKLKYDAWVENGWEDGNDKKIKNWKSKLLQTLKYLQADEKNNIVKQKLKREYKIIRHDEN